MQKIDFTQYKTKEAFLKDFEIKNGILDLSNQQMNDDDLKHILELIGEESSLKGLDLNDNELTTLPVGVFKRLSSLERLYLGFNKFATLTAGAFKGLSSLEILYLLCNQFTTLPTSLRAILPNCDIIKDSDCIFVDDVASNQETPVIEKSNVIELLNAQLQDVDNAIAKLQSVKENIQKTIKIMETTNI